MQTATARTAGIRETDGRRMRTPLTPAWDAPAGTSLLQADVVRVFDVEPDLLDGVEPRCAELLRRRVGARRVHLEPGAWTPPGADTMGSALGLLVIRGLLTRTVELDGRRCPELVGAGDVLRPWDTPDGSIAHEATWTALERTELAVLDERFAAIVCRFPSIVGALMSRAVHRSRALSLHLAIAHVRHADVRLRLLMWHLADRWGRVTPDGVHVPLRLTHEMLGELACMRRPTASSALNQLMREGELLRRSDGTWMLAGEPPMSAAA